jgi:FKBP-type peptidyl-prolyl cis-trans isomerase
MKKTIFFFSAFLLGSLALLVSSCSVAPGTAKKVVLNNDIDSVSYAIGIDIAGNLKRNGFDEINPEAIAKGFDDVFKDAEYLIDPEAANQYVMDYFNKSRDKKALKNLQESEEFLSKNKGEAGVITTESGLQYKIIQEGTGPVPTETDRVSVYYKGTLIDGTEFDGTEVGNPARFPVTGVIRGWTEALLMMPVGSKWMLYIHPDLAYGSQPRQGGPIQPNNALIFEIELLEINPQ